MNWKKNTRSYFFFFTKQYELNTRVGLQEYTNGSMFLGAKTEVPVCAYEAATVRVRSVLRSLLDMLRLN